MLGQSPEENNGSWQLLNKNALYARPSMVKVVLDVPKDRVEVRCINWQLTTAGRPKLRGNQYVLFSNFTFSNADHGILYMVYQFRKMLIPLCTVIPSQRQVNVNMLTNQ